MFSSKARNRKVNAPERQGLSSDPRETVARLKEESFQLNAQIGALEEVIAGHVIEEERQEEMRRCNILPPPEYKEALEGRAPMTRSQMRRKKQKEQASMFRFLLLLGIAMVLAFWLLRTGG